MLEAPTRDEDGRASPNRGSAAVRLICFVGISLVLHALFAVAWMVATLVGLIITLPIIPRSAPTPVEMVWFDGSGGGASPREVDASPPAPRQPPTQRLQAVGIGERRRIPPPAPSSARSKGVPSEVPAPAEEVSPPTVPSWQDETQEDEAAATAVMETAIRSLLESAARQQPGRTGGRTGVLVPLGAQGGAGPGRDAPGSGIPEELRAYAQGIYESIARQRRYPEVAVRLGMQGTVQVQLRFLRSGALMEPPRIYSSSGQGVLDAEALRMAKAAGPFPPLPSVVPHVVLGLVIPVEFSLQPAP
jgi:protein TonB